MIRDNFTLNDLTDAFKNDNYFLAKTYIRKASMNENTQFLDDAFSTGDPKILNILYNYEPNYIIKSYDMGNRDDELINWALKLHNLDFIKRIITEYPDFKYKHIAGGNYDRKYTPFTYACYMGRVDIVDYFLSEDIKIDVNFSDDLVDPAIIVSVEWIDVVMRLLEHGANPNVTSLEYGDTALHEAAKNENALPIIIDHLIAHGADPRILNKRDMPPIFFCRGPHGVEKMERLYKYAPDTLYHICEYPDNDVASASKIGVINVTVEVLDYNTTKFALEHCCDPRLDSDDLYGGPALPHALFKLRSGIKYDKTAEDSDPNLYNLDYKKYVEYEDKAQLDFLKKLVPFFDEYFKKFKLLRLIRAYMIYHTIKDRERTVVE